MEKEIFFMKEKQHFFRNFKSEVSHKTSFLSKDATKALSLFTHMIHIFHRI